MLVKQGSLVKQAFWGTVGRIADTVVGAALKPVGWAVGGAIKAPFKAVGSFGSYAFKNPAGAVGIGGVALSDFNVVKDGVSAASAAAATPYRYF